MILFTGLLLFLVSAQTFVVLLVAFRRNWVSRCTYCDWECKARNKQEADDKALAHTFKCRWHPRQQIEELTKSSKTLRKETIKLFDLKVKNWRTIRSLRKQRQHLLDRKTGQ